MSIPFKLEDYHVASKTRSGKWPFPLAKKYPILAAPEVAEMIPKCSRCFNCAVSSLADYAPNCPSYEYGKWESYLPTGRIRIAQGILRGLVKPDEHVVQRIFSCTLCAACRETCAPVMAFDPTVILKAMRDQLVDLGLGPMPEQKLFPRNVAKTRNIYNEKAEDRTAWLPEKLKPKADLVYFVGCTTAYRTPKIAKSTYNILKAAGANFTVMDLEWCCGSPMYMTGQKKEAKETFEKNLETIEAIGARTLITSCPGCYKMFKLEYPKLTDKKRPFEVLHVTEYVNNLINQDKLKLKKKIAIKATYHDPCHLGRYCGVYNPPREIIENIPGIKFVEMERIGRAAWCCGAGAGTMASFPALAQHSATARLREAVEFAEAKALISACPFCNLNLTRTAEQVEPSIAIYDIVELVARSIT